MNAELVTRWERPAAVVGAVVIALLGASFQTHSWPSTIMVLIPTVIILGLAARRPADVPPPPGIRRGVLVWSILLGLALAWEAYAFVRQPNWSLPDPANPTISTLLDPVLEQGPLRIVGWLAWLAVGWRLVTR